MTKKDFWALVREAREVYQIVGSMNFCITDKEDFRFEGKVYPLDQIYKGYKYAYIEDLETLIFQDADL